MAINLRKSFRIGKNTRINFSKNGGIGISTGIKGFRISKNRYGVRFTLGGKGVYYTKWFTKKKKKNKKKKIKQDENIKRLNEEEILVAERVIDPETDFERIPSEDEKALLLYLGSHERNYVLYGLLTALVCLVGYLLFKKNFFLSYMLVTINVSLLGYYLFQSKMNAFIFKFNRSISLFNKNKLDKSYKLLKKCLAIKPNSVKAIILMMFTTFKLEKYDEALEYVKQYKKENEALEVMYFIEGYANTFLCKYKEGIEAIEKVYSEEDDIRYAKFKILGDCHLGLGDLDKAISWYEELPVKEKEMNDDILEYKYALGKALLLSGNKKRAFTYLSKVYDYQVDYKDVKMLMQEI